MKWYYVVVPGVLALILFCCCAGGAAYYLYGDDLREGFGPGAEATAGCEEAIRKAPEYGAAEAGNPSTHRLQAAHYRMAAQKATDPAIRAAILEVAGLLEKYAVALTEYNLKKSAKTATTKDLDVLSEALEQRRNAYGQVLELCRAAGFK